MFLSTPAKIFPAICVLSIAFAGCSLWQSNENSAATFASETKSEYPFVAREPEVFQAEIVVRTGETQRRTFIARDGQKRRMDLDMGTDDHRAVVITDKEYLLYFKRKVLEEHDLSSNAAEHYEPLTAQIMNLRDYARFEEIGRDGSIVQFRARVNASTNSEVLVFFDQSIGMTVRQEFYSIDGAQRSLQYSVELKNFRPEAEPELFAIPPDFRRQARNK
jgi:hypothetical protein